MFEDESGFSRVCALKHTWAIKGETPMVKTQISKHGRINAVGFLIISPGWRKIKLSIKLHKKNVTGAQILQALHRLLKRVRGPIMLLWDRHKIHKTPEINCLLKAHPRLQVFEFPKAAPELNPSEGIWAQMDEYLAGTSPKTVADLANIVKRAGMRTRNSSKRLWACLAQSDLPFN